MSEESSAATHIALDQYLAAIGSAAERLHDQAALAGLTAAVPSCPGWDVAALVAHQGMVHRWAAANVSGDSDHRTEDSEAAAAAAPDLLAWFDEGVHALTKILFEAPDDLEAMVFLRHAPPPRLFWARRQAHETTIHAVDAQAAALRRLPSAAETMINDELAADGIDELLRGFLPRSKSTLRSKTPYVVEIRPTDSERRWQVVVSERPPSSVQGIAWPPDAVISGAAIELYLGLWNRNEHLYAEGRQEVIEQWRSEVRVSW